MLFNVGQYVISVTAAWLVHVRRRASRRRPGATRRRFEPARRRVDRAVLARLPPGQPRAGRRHRRVRQARPCGSRSPRTSGTTRSPRWRSSRSRRSSSRCRRRPGGSCPLLLLPLFAVYKTASISRAKERAVAARRAHRPAQPRCCSSSASTAGARRRRAATAPGSRCSCSTSTGSRRSTTPSGHPVGRRPARRSSPRRLLGAVRPERHGRPARRRRVRGAAARRSTHPDDAIEVAGRIRTALAEPFHLEGVLLDVEASASASRCRPQHGDDGRGAHAPRRRRDVRRQGRAAPASRSTTPRATRNSPTRLGTRGRRCATRSTTASSSCTTSPRSPLDDGTVVGRRGAGALAAPRARPASPPDEFVPLAERTGLIHRLTAFVLRPGARPGRATGGAHGMQVPVAVNVSHARPAGDRPRGASSRPSSTRTACPPSALVPRGHRERAGAGPGPRGRDAARARRPRRLAARSTTSAPATPRCCCSSSCRSPRSRSTARSSRRLDEADGDPAIVRSIVGFAHGARPARRRRGRRDVAGLEASCATWAATSPRATASPGRWPADAGHRSGSSSGRPRPAERTGLRVVGGGGARPDRRSGRTAAPACAVRRMTRMSETPSITRDDVAHLARLARIDLPPDAARPLRRAARGHPGCGRAGRPRSPPTTCPPTSHPMPLVNVFREDVVRPSLTNAEALSGAPSVESERFRVPRILDEE